MVDGSRHCFLPRCIQCHYSWCQCRCLKLRGRNEGKINDSLCMFLSSLHSPTSMYSLAMEGSELRNCHWDLQTTVCLPNFLKLHSELLCVLECTESIRNCGREIELSNFFLHFRQFTKSFFGQFSELQHSMVLNFRLYILNRIYENHSQYSPLFFHIADLAYADINAISQ